ncbi:MAG: hypothetical protein WCQ63_05135 [Methanomethylophilus sp.]|jgi:hypothetical protein
MNHASRKEVFAPASSKVYPMICQITGEGFAYRIIQDNVDHVIGGETFYGTDFSYNPPNPNADDSTSQISIDDTDRKLISLIASFSGDITVTFGIIDEDDPTSYLDGPFEHTVTSKSYTSSGKITLKLSALSRLGYTASRYSYSSSEFPGLIG